MGRLSEESGVVQLVAAVKEHKKFKQLACYSIDTITKNISPPNTYWRSALWQARDASAAKHVIDVLKLHRGHEQVVNVSVLCLIRLAVDPQCADDIVRLGGMDVVLESALANPDLPTKSLALVLELLDALGKHPACAERLASPALVAKLFELNPRICGVMMYRKSLFAKQVALLKRATARDARLRCKPTAANATVREPPRTVASPAGVDFASVFRQTRQRQQADREWPSPRSGRWPGSRPAPNLTETTRRSGPRLPFSMDQACRVPNMNSPFASACPLRGPSRIRPSSMPAIISPRSLSPGAM